MKSESRPGLESDNESTYICIGSNEDTGKDKVLKAIVRLTDFIDIITVSDIYKTPEIHGNGAPYHNAVIRTKTDIDRERLDMLFKDIEREFGRDELARRDARVPIDIDIVICKGIVLRPKDYNQSFFQIGYKSILSSDCR